MPKREPNLPEMHEVTPPNLLENLSDMYRYPAVALSAMEYVLHRAVVALVMDGFDKKKVLKALGKMTQHGPKEYRNREPSE